MSIRIKAPFSDPLWLSRDISPYYGESHRLLQRETRAYVDEHIVPFCEQWERQGSIPTEALIEHARRGYVAASVCPLAKDYLQGQCLPGNVSPDEWDDFHSLIVCDEISRCGYLGVVWGLSGGTAIGAPPIVNHGSEQQKQQYLPLILSGKTRFCLAITEPGAGSDVAAISTTAERRGDVYVVNGAKKWITNAVFADYCTAAVRTGGKGRKSISVLVIPLNAAGVTRRRMENSGVHASGSTYIDFDNVQVPLSNLIGRENDGFAIIMSNFNNERLSLACASLRLARCCIEDAYLYATRRETFGRPLIANQVIRNKFSAAGRQVESAQALMEQLVYTHLEAKRTRSGRDASTLTAGLFASLKVLAAQTLESVNREAQQVMGGVGYSRGGRGARVEQISRDVRVMVIGGGSEEILTDLALSQEERALARL